MDDFVAYSSRLRVALIVLGCLLFVILGLWLIGALGALPESRRYSQSHLQAIGWLSMTFFGFVAISRIPQLLKASVQLRLSDAGLCWREWSDETIPWTEISEVSTLSFHGQRAIIIHLKNPDHFPGRGLRALLNMINCRFAGGDLLISMNSTDRSFDEAMAAIERFCV